MRRPITLIVLLLALSFPGGAAAQVNGRDGGTGIDESRGGRDSGGNWPPRRVQPTPPPPEVIVVPRRRATPTRRTRPTPTRRVRKPRPLPGQVVLSDRIDPAHSIRTPLIRGDARLLPNGDFEFITVGPREEAAAAVQALSDAGAVFVRQRVYPNLDRRTMAFDANGLGLAQIRGLLDVAAPGTEADVHAIYRYAAGAPRLYAADLVTAPEAPACAGPAGLRIGQVDGAVEAGHSALKGTGLVSHSVLDDRFTAPHSDHGTAVAALLVGQDETGALSGFAPGAQLFAANAFAAEGAGGATDIERIAAALDWLVGQKVQLVNLSFAGPVNSAMAEVLSATADQEVALIAAAGNQGSESAVYPAAADPVIGVTAVDAALRRYSAANTGAHVEFAAPGVDLYVANREGGGYASGTSYAAPILAGLAARLVAQGITDPDELRARLQASSVDLGETGRDSAYGWGLVKAPGC